MFLSRLISRCEPDGSLVLDLQKEAGASFRCGPFSRGMPWQKWSDSGWVDTTPDPDVQLVNRAHAAHQHFIDILTGYAGIAQRGLDGGGAEFGGGHRGQGTLEGANGGAAGGNNNNRITHNVVNSLVKS